MFPLSALGGMAASVPGAFGGGFAKGDTPADWAKVGQQLRPQYEQSWQQGKIPGSPGYEASVAQNPDIDPQTGQPWQATDQGGWGNMRYPAADPALNVQLQQQQAQQAAQMAGGMGGPWGNMRYPAANPGLNVAMQGGPWGAALGGLAPFAQQFLQRGLGRPGAWQQIIPRGPARWEGAGRENPYLQNPWRQPGGYVPTITR
jgi:hypothetical protein